MTINDLISKLQALPDDIKDNDLYVYIENKNGSLQDIEGIETLIDSYSGQEQTTISIGCIDPNDVNWS